MVCERCPYRPSGRGCDRLDAQGTTCVGLDAGSGSQVHCFLGSDLSSCPAANVLPDNALAWADGVGLGAEKKCWRYGTSFFYNIPADSPCIGAPEPEASPPPTPTPAPQAVAVTFEGYEYRALMHGILPDGRNEKICHLSTTWLPLLEGFELAPDISAVRQSVVAAHPWSTDVVVLASLKAYGTANFVGRTQHTPGEEYGDEQPKAVARIVDGRTVYSCPWLCYQILVRKRVSAEPFESSGDISKPISGQLFASPWVVVSICVGVAMCAGAVALCVGPSEANAQQFLLVEFMDVLMDFMGYLLTKAEGDLDFANDPTGIIANVLLGTSILGAIAFALEVGLQAQGNGIERAMGLLRPLHFAGEDVFQFLLYCAVAGGQASDTTGSSSMWLFALAQAVAFVVIKLVDMLCTSKEPPLPTWSP